MMSKPVPIALFRLGEITVTPNAIVQLSPDDLWTAIGRHQAGDWGDLDEAGRQENSRSLENGSCLCSIYHAANGTRFYVITEADRSVTTVLLPEDY
jgi:hypothetical protein